MSKSIVKRKGNGLLARLLTAMLIISMFPTIGTLMSEPVSAASVLQNDSLSVQIGNIGQIEVFNIRNNRNNRTNGQPNFVMPNNESNLNTATHQYMGELIFSTRSAENAEDLAGKPYQEQDVNKTLAAAPAGAMTQYSNFTDANLAANPNIDIDFGEDKVTVDYKGFGLDFNTARAMKGYDVRQEWNMDTPDDSLERTITVKNVSDQYIEFGDMGLPMPWNNKYNSRAASYNDRMMVHNFAGADSGYTQIIRPSGEGNYLLFAPVPSSDARIEYVEYVQSRANFQGVTGYRANSVYGGLGGDDGGWQPGLNILYQHAKNVYAGNGGAYMPVSTFTSKVLAPGAEMTYKYKYFAVRAGDNSPQDSATSPNNASDKESEREANMRSILYKNGMMDMLAVPSFSTFLNVPTKLDLHYDDKRISDVQLNIMSVYENDPYDLEHIPNTGTPYNVNNTRGGRGLEDAPENAAYQRSVSSPVRTVDERGEAHHIYTLSFDTIGNNSVGVSYKLNGVQKYTECEFSVMPEISSVIDTHAAFNYGNRVTEGTYTGQYLESTMHGANSSNTQSADDWGWDQGNFMAMKNLLRPDQDEITSLESLLIDLYWGKPLINHSTYAVSNAFAGTGSRVFTHQMAATNFFTMYQILKTYPELEYRDGYDAKWYLNIAYNIYNLRVVTSTSTGYYGEQFIEPLIAALRAEDMTTEADTLQARFTGATSGKGYTMATASYPYGSEFSFDNTGEEGAYFSAKALRTFAPSHAQYDRAYQNMLLAEWKTRASRGLQPTWFHYSNVVFLGGEGWWNSQYTTPLAAAIMDDYIRYQDNGYDNDERAWAERTNYAAKLSAFSHVNMGQIASTGIGNISWRYTAFKGRFGAMNVNDQNGNRIQYNGWNDFSGEADENLYGTLLRLSSDVVTDPIFGLFGYGCEAVDNGGSYTVKPLDGVSKKINLMNEKIYLEFNRDEIVTADIAKTGNYMTFTLNNQLGTDHDTQLSLEGLSTDGEYYVVKDGVQAPVDEFTVGDGKGVAEIAMTEEDATVDLLVILASDYSLDGPTVMAELSSNNAFTDVPVGLAGAAFNADSYAWSVTKAPIGAGYSITGGDTLSPEFTTDTAGNYTVRLTATDSDENSAYAEVEIEVLDRADFAAPVIDTASITPGKIFPNYNYQLTGIASTSIPGGNLTYKWSGPSSAVFSDANAASPAVSFGTVGAYTLKLTVTDDIGRVTSRTLIVNVLDLSQSDPPEIVTAAIVTGKMFPGYNYQLTGNATTGVPGGSIVYSWSGPAGVTFSDAAAASPAVKFDEPGVYELTLTVTDDIGRTASLPVEATVLDLSESDPPEVTTANLDAASPVVGTSYGLVGIATTGIPGSDALTYKWTVFPSNGVTFGGTGANSAFPTVTFSIPRTYQFTFTATDKIGRTDSKTFSVVVADNLTPLNVALTSKGTTLQNIHQNGAARTAPLTGGDVARAAASTLNTWGTASSASRHWFQLTFPDPVTIYGVDIMWSSDGGGTNAPNAGTAGNRNELLVPAADPAVPMVNDALTVPAANWTALALKDKSGAAIDDIPRVTNGTSTNNVWNFAGFDPVDSQYLLTVLNRPGSGNGVGINYWRAYVLEPTHSVEDVYVHVTGNELENAVRQAEVFPAAYETAVKKIDFSESKYAYLNHDIALKWTQSQIDAAIAAEAGVETVVTGTNNTLGYSLRVHVVKSAAAPVVVDYVPVTVMAEVGETVSMPETVIANLDDGSQHTLPVTWDVPAGVTDTAGTKTINGAVVLPSGWTGPATLTATLSVVADARAYLADRLLAFELLSEADYISGSYATALLVYDAAKAIYDYPEALPEELTQAANDLNAAIEWLDGEKAIDAVLLDMLLDFIDLYNDLYDVEEDSGMWTPESLAAFRAAIDAAQAIADAPGNYSVNDAETALAAIIEAYDALEASVDKSLLASIIAQAESILLTDGDKLITSARVNLIAKLDAAKLVYDDAEATEAEVIAAWTDLLSAITEAGQFKGDTARLSALMSLVRNTAGTNYTPASFTAFTAALAGAQTVIDNADDYTQTRIDEAYDRLYSAWRGLTRLANFAALQAAVNAAQAIVDDIDDYVPDSVAGLADELAAAKTVLADSDSTQAEVNAASSALTAKIVLARLKEDKSKLNAAYSSAKSVKTSLYTMGSVETLSSAMEAAKIIIEAPVGDFTQAQVDKATDRVNGAVKALIRLTDVVTDAVSSVADQDDSAKAVAGDDKDKGKTEGKGGKAANSEEAVSGDIETADPAAESPAPAADDTDDVQVAAVTNADVAQIVEPATPLAQGVDAVVTGGDATVSETGAVGAVVDAARAPADGGASNIAYIVLVSLICALAGFMTFLVRSRKKQTK